MITRRFYGCIFILTCFILLTSVYLQVFDGFQPCPLCTLQRLTFVLLGLFSFLGFLINPTRLARLLINLLLLITSSIGILLAGRQVWLQYFATNVSSECGVSLEYMLRILPVNEVFQKVMAGSAECSQLGASFLYLNTAQWALVWFVLFFSFSIYLLGKKQ